MDLNLVKYQYLVKYLVKYHAHMMVFIRLETKRPVSYTCVTQTYHDSMLTKHSQIEYEHLWHVKAKDHR